MVTEGIPRRISTTSVPMNLRDLRYLIAVAEHKHFGKAAEACFVSQPTLSGQIKKLEDQLGVVLFERTKRHVEITPIGERILEQARAVEEHVKGIESLARFHQDPLAGPLKLGMIPTLGPYLTSLMLLPLRRRFPQMRLVLFEDITEHLLERLRRREIDAALLATPVDTPDLVDRPLFDEPFWLAIPRDHRLYATEEITLKDLPGEELLLLADGHCLARQVAEVCRLQDEAAGVATGDLRASSLETLIQLVGAGFGCTLVPALALRGSWTTDAGVVVRPLQMPDAFRRVRLAHRPGFPRLQALDALAELVRERLPNTVRSLFPNSVVGWDEAKRNPGMEADREHERKR